MVRLSMLMLAAIPALSACGASYRVDPVVISSVAAEPAPSKALVVQLAEAELRRRLRDPDSAQFEWPNELVAGAHQPLMARPIYGFITCGSVNARNAFGGYVGRSYILVVARQGRIVFLDFDNGNATLVQGYCRNVHGMN